jgi:PKD repeat protein
MKKTFTILLITFLSITSYAQCLIEPWSLQVRTDKSELIVEAKVISQEGAWDQNHGNIYTINTLEVYKTFKGQYNSETIQLVTEGGLVGLEKEVVTPSLELELGEVGVFMIKRGIVKFNRTGLFYQPTASVQSFVKYDLNAVKAFDISQTYPSIKFGLYPNIESCTGNSFHVVKEFDAEANNRKIKALAPPTITSFSATTINAGASVELTISGSNFGFGRGSGGVGFKDANFGDGRYYYSPTGWSYNQWSNSQIKVIVPSRAGTGTIQVINNNGEFGESTSDLTVDWSHLNLAYPISSSDTPFFELQHIDDNSNGGYTWQMTSEFSGDSGAVGAFIRSLNEWKCETEMNWDIGTDATIDTAEADDVNIVEFTTFGDSRLAVCRSYYTGCFISGGSDMRWYVKELDISFDRTYSWYYGTASPSFFQYDFESVATHELGHGHQLGHVRDNAKVMHYSISNGQRKPELATTDIACGIYVKTKGITTSICNQGKMTVGICPANPPIADFFVHENNPCLSNAITVTDASVGQEVSYSWDFGSEATPATATTKGPHAVAYGDTTTATIRLIATNANGIDTIEKEITVKGNPVAKYSESVDGTRITFTNESENGTSFLWTFGDGGTSTEENPVHNYADRGDYVTSLQATNKCGDSTLSKDFMLRFNVGIEDLTNSFTIYPNPVQNGKAISIEGSKANKYSLHTLDGRLINEGAIVNNVFIVDVVQPAIYVLTLSKDGESVNYRIQVTE